MDGGFKLWYDGKYYGSEAAKDVRIVSYLEIMVLEENGRG